MLPRFDPTHLEGAAVDAVIIGSGIGGLTAAAKLAEAGKRVVVFEQHTVAGGCTHTFVENGAEFETGLHYVGASIMDRSAGTRQLLDSICDKPVEWELVEEGADRVYDVVRIMDPRGSGVAVEFRVPRGREQQIQALCNRFPADQEAIHAYFDLIAQSQKQVTGHFVAQGIRRLLGAIPLGGLGLSLLIDKTTDRVFRRSFLAYADRTVSDVLTDLFPENATLRAVLGYLWGNIGCDPSDASFAAYAMVVSHYLPGACFPRGGSATLAQQIVPFIERHNTSRVFVRSPVQSITVDARGSANGVIIKVGEEDHTVHAPIIINCTGVANTARLLKEATPSAFPRDMPRQSTGHLSLFISYVPRDLELRSANRWIFPGSDHAKNVADYNRDPEHVAFPAVFVSFPSTKDPSRRDANVQTCHVVAPVPYQVFSRVLETEGTPRRRNRTYENLKQAFADRLFALIEREFPTLRSAIYDTDVIRGKQCSLGTPISNAYYLGSERGSSYGVAATPERFRSLSCLVVTPVPGLFQGGQDVVSAGVTGAMMGGFFAALCASPRPMLGLRSKVGASNRQILRDL